MEETLRRSTRGPHSSEDAGFLSKEEAEELESAVDGLCEGDAERKRRARGAFSPDERE